MVDAYYRGLWMLLPFTMQMTLILVLSAVVSSTPLFRAAVVALADRPTTLAQVVSLAVGLGAALGYFYWGLGVALAPIIAIHFSAAAERKKIPVDFPFLLAAVSAGTGIWQFGLSSTPALLMATPGHFLDATVGVLSLRSTIWSLPAVLMVLTFPVGVVLLTIALMPKVVRPLSAFPERRRSRPHASRMPGCHLQCRARPGLPRGPSELAHSRDLAVGLFVWLYHHFVTKGHSLDLNAMNTLLLLVALLLHRKRGVVLEGDPELGTGVLADPRAVSPVRRRRGTAAVHHRRRGLRRGVRERRPRRSRFRC